MKVFALVALLVCVCSLEGALVKREAEQEQQQAPLDEFVKTVHNYMNTAHTYVTTELGQQEKLEELKARAQTILQAVRDRMDPVAAQVRQAVTDFFSTVIDTARTYAPKQ